MKVLFLDIDGVLNNGHTKERFQGFIGLNKELIPLVKQIIDETGCQVVLSSYWRTDPKSVKHVRQHIGPLFDKTPIFTMKPRGTEIQAWLDEHPAVTKYAILDDDSDMLEEQLPNFFQTSFNFGITEDTMNKVIEHLGRRDP